MDYRPLLPAPLMKPPHIAAFDPIIRNNVGLDTDLTNVEQKIYYVTVLNFDTVPAVMLPYLAKMFGVEGFKGFDYAPTEALKRQTLKNAVLMHRRHGTRWALRVALENAGFQNVQILDHLEPLIYLDGTWMLDGSFILNSEHWAHFKVEMEPPVGVLAEDVDVERLMLLINYWKRACTLCVGVTIAQLIIDVFGIGDSIPLYLDGSFELDGSQTLDGIVE